jgi:agmatinase
VSADGNSPSSHDRSPLDPPPRVNSGAKVGPVDASRIPRFVGDATFARLPRPDEVGDIDIAVLGVPFDAGVTYRPGARFGPAHVRDSSRLIRPYNPALDVEPFGVAQVSDVGDLAVTPFSIEDAVASIEAGARAVSERAEHLVTIGGDHTIALPLLRAAHRRHGPVAVVHFDAHLDTWDTYFGQPLTHGTPFRRAAEEGLTDPDGCLHIGTRASLYAASDLDDDRGFGYAIVSADDVQDLGTRGSVEKMRERVQDRPVYVSVDIDVLEPGLAPGTGTPELGGLLGRELLGIIRGLAGLNVVGGDVVEVAPAYDHAQITGIAAAHVLYELISVIAVGGSTTGRGS